MTTFDPAAAVLATNLKHARMASGLTLRQLSDHMSANGHSIAPSGLSELETCKKRVTVLEMLALASVLGVPPMDLLAGLAQGDNSFEAGRRLGIKEAQTALQHLQ